METVMITREMATLVFNAVWEGTRQKDHFFQEALQIHGVTEEEFDRLRGEARKQERQISRLVVFAPMGSGRRR